MPVKNCYNVGRENETALLTLSRNWLKHFKCKTINILTRQNKKTRQLLGPRFRRRTVHEPNQIRIKADPNYLDRLN